MSHAIRIHCILVLLAIGIRASAQPAVAAGGTGDGPPIELTCVGVSVPAVVHVKVLFPRDAAGAPTTNPIDARYEWDFGDPGSRYNELPGWNAAHIYEKPGQYTVTLTVRGPDGRETKRSTWVRVAPDDRKKVYVSADGNDQLDGGTPGRAVRTPYRAFAVGRENAHILFRRGDTFDIATPVNITGRGVRVGNYARLTQPGITPTADPLPVLRKVQGPPQPHAETMFYNQPTAADTFFEGIEFDSIWSLTGEYGSKKIPARALTVGGTNFAIRWCSFRNLTDAINTEMKPTGVLVQENTFSNEIRGYCVYSNGQDHAYIGNAMNHSTNEHLIRATEPGCTRMLIAYNDLRRRGKIKGSLELRCASWFYVAGNYFNDGTCRVGPQEQDKARWPNWADIKCEWGVLQDNRIDDAFLNVRLGTYHLNFRNNIIRMNPRTGPLKNEDGYWAMIVECHKPDYDQVRKIADVRIEHNTIINLWGQGHLLHVGGKPVSMSIRQNVYITDGKGQADGIVFTTDPGDGVSIRENVYPEGRGGQHQIARQVVERSAWLQNPIVKGDRFGRVPIDAEDNVPIETNAGAKLGNDRSPREAKKKAAGG